MLPIQIALVDEHRLFRSGLATLINNYTGYNVLFEVANGEELIVRILPQFKPDIVLIDISVPATKGASTVQWLKNNYPGIGIIALSTPNDAEKVLDMLKMGVKGYVLKDTEPAEFKRALEKVSKGEVYYPEFVTRLLVENISQEGGHEKLNPRETEFLKLAATELTYKEIAIEMGGISVRTVDGYRDQLFEKLHIKSRIGLVRYAIKNKLIDL